MGDDSMICRTDIANLKTDIGEKIGQKIIVKGSLGRSKAFEKEATIEKTYPNIFVVKYAENDRNVTYSYTDVLTRTVEVEVFDGDTYSPLIPAPIETKIVSGVIISFNLDFVLLLFLTPLFSFFTFSNFLFFILF